MGSALFATAGNFEGAGSEQGAAGCGLQASGGRHRVAGSLLETGLEYGYVPKCRCCHQADESTQPKVILLQRDRASVDASHLHCQNQLYIFPHIYTYRKSPSYIYIYIGLFSKRDERRSTKENQFAMPIPNL